MKKNILIIAAILTVIGAAILAVIGIIGHGLLTDGFFYYGDGWQDSPEKALEVQVSESTLEEAQSLSVKHLLDTMYVDDGAIMTFVSNADTFVTVWFETNDSGKYHFYGFSEEESLEDPVSFILNGNQEQWILSPYQQSGTMIYGWKYASAPAVVVNGFETETKKYLFECQEKTWEIEYWWTNIADENDEITIQYKT